MITTYLGNEIEIRRYFPQSREVEAVRVSDRVLRMYSVDFLKADGGLNEIWEAVRKADPESMTGLDNYKR